MRAYIQWVLRNRKWLILACLILTILAGYEMRNLRINSDVTSYLPADDPAVALFNYIGQEYSSSWAAIIILKSENVFTANNLNEISQITQSVSLIPGIEYVVSLTNVMDIRSDEWGFEITRLIDEYELPTEEAELADLQEYTLSKSMYKGRLVSADSRYTLILCQISPGSEKNTVAREIKDLVKGMSLQQQVYFEGMPFQVLSIMEFIVQDLLLLTPLIVLVIILMLYLGFNQWRWVFLPVFTVGMGIVWTMSLMSLFGVELTPISDALPVVLFAVGSAYGIHVVNKIRLQPVGQGDHQNRLLGAVSEISSGVLLAGMTTFVGFLSFVFSSYLTIIRDFGVYAAIGILLILWLSITFIPAVSSFFEYNTFSKKPWKRLVLPFDKWLRGLSHLVKHFSTLILYGSLVLLIVGIIGIPFIGRKVDILEYFKPSSDLRQSAAIMNLEFGGSLPVQVLIKADMHDPASLHILDTIGNYISAMEGLSNPRSLVDYITLMNDAMGEGECIPDSRDKVQNLWFMIESEDVIAPLVHYDLEEGVLYASMQNLETKRIHEINDSLMDFLEAIQEPGIELQASGMQAIYASLDDSMMKNLIQSMLLAFVFVFAAMVFLIASLRGALAGISILVFSMVLVFGFMGYASIPLDIATILIAGITIGIGIDYSIHFTTAYKTSRKKGLDIDRAIEETLKTTGRGIIINVLTIMMGFLVLVMANLIPLQQFGLLIAFSMLCAGFSAITLLPALIKTFNISIIKKNNKS